MFCAVHKERIALTECASCGKPICGDCEIILKAKPYCHGCSKLDIPGIEHTAHRVPFMALILSFLVPGAGQVYNGQYSKGIFIFMTCWLIVPWAYGTYDAYINAWKINRHKISTRPSIELLIVYLGVAVFLLWFALPQKWPSLEKMMYGDRGVRKTLLKLSEAAEQYREDWGEYPSDPGDLYFASPPYLDEVVCGQEAEGYSFACEFFAEGYRAIAASVKFGEQKRYQVTTGGEVKRMADVE